jgi:hypothetical protein
VTTTIDVTSTRAADAELRKQISTIEADIARLDARRAELSLAAHADGDTKAKRDLEDVHRQRMSKSIELEDLQHALQAAHKRADIAERAASVERERQRAEKGAVILERLAQRGARMDAALKAYRDDYAGADADLNELRRLGIGAPGPDLARVNFRNCHDSAMSGLDLKTAVIPPQRRRDWNTLLRGYVEMGTAWIANRLNKHAAEAA